MERAWKACVNLAPFPDTWAFSRADRSVVHPVYRDHWHSEPCTRKLPLFQDFHLIHDHVFKRTVLEIRRCGPDLMDNVHAFHDLAENGVMAIEPRRWPQG